jgi:hypothetical protein
VVTTPNVEHNVRFEGLAPGSLRHRDHRFEWTRAEFRAWAERVAAEYGYGVRLVPVGVDDPEVGPPTQMAVFTHTVADVTDPKAARTGTGQPPGPSSPTSTPTLPGFEPVATTTATTGGGTR